MNGDHTVHKSWGRMVFWKQNIACGQLDKWGLAEIYVKPHWGVSTLKVSDSVLLDKLVSALDLAVECGKKLRSKEFQELLNDDQ